MSTNYSSTFEAFVWKCCLRRDRSPFLAHSPRVPHFNSAFLRPNSVDHFLISLARYHYILRVYMIYVHWCMIHDTYHDILLVYMSTSYPSYELHVSFCTEKLRRLQNTFLHILSRPPIQRMERLYCVVLLRSGAHMGWAVCVVVSLHAGGKKGDAL